MTNEGRPSGSRRIDPELRQRAIVMRRDEKKTQREIVEATGISLAHLKTILKEEGIKVPQQPRRYGTPRPNARTARKGKKGNNGNTGKRRVDRNTVVRDPDKPEPPKPTRSYSPIVAMDIERRLRKRREEAERAVD